MRKKSSHATVVFVAIAVLLLAVAAFLLVDFTSEKAFSDLCQDIEQYDSCKIFCVMVDREEEIVLTGDVFDAFVSRLEQQKYYKRGSYDNIMEGTIYHIFFSSKQADPFEMIVSDLGKVYIGSNYYEFSSDANPKVISSYIEKLFE